MLVNYRSSNILLGMRVAVAQINPIVGDLRGNTKKILTFIERARENRPDLILFSELTICGYPPADLLLHESFVQEMQECLHEIAKNTHELTVVVGLARHNPSVGEKPLFNSAAVIQSGKILGYYDKCLLPTYDVFDERRYFTPGQGIKTWEIKGQRVAIIICEDIWQHSRLADSNYPFDPIEELVPHKPDLLLNLSSSPYNFQKPAVRISVCGKAAKTLKCAVVMSCQIGGNDDLIFDGYSNYVDEKGVLRQLGKGFEEDLFVVDTEEKPDSPTLHEDPMHELYQALVLGVRDYFAKQGFKKACLGLSGGIDSALVACIAVDALGAKNVLGIGMPSRYSSEGSVKDAEDLARNLRIDFHVIPIEAPFNEYLKLLGPQFAGRAPDVTEENLQARIRGMLLMALSNKLGYIVLSTGNKSELGLGYCTLYGDMAGGLGVINDLYKTQVYQLSKWLNRTHEVIPWSTIEKPPSAELRPGQKDIDSMPDYAIVDAVLKEYVEDYLTAEEIAKRHRFPLEVVKDLIVRLHRAEYKRRQGPPGIRVSKKAFSVGRRFPIVQKWV